MNTANVFPGTEELIAEPGANKSTIDALFEKFDTTSLFVVEPTVTAVEMHPGAPTAFVKLSFPEAITVAMPALRS